LSFFETNFLMQRNGDTV